MNQNLDVAIHLLKRFPQKINVWGKSWLHNACLYGHLKLLNYLVENPNLHIDFNVIVYGYTPLNIACIEGQYEVVKLLLENLKEKGIDITKKSTSKRHAQLTAEEIARVEGHTDILELFSIFKKIKNKY